MTLKEALKTLQLSRSPVEEGFGLMGCVIVGYDWMQHIADMVLMQPSFMFDNVPLFLRCSMPSMADYRYLRLKLYSCVWERAGEDTIWLAGALSSEYWKVLDSYGVAAAVRRLP